MLTDMLCGLVKVLFLYLADTAVRRSQRRRKKIEGGPKLAIRKENDHVYYRGISSDVQAAV